MPTLSSQHHLYSESARNRRAPPAVELSPATILYRWAERVAENASDSEANHTNESDNGYSSGEDGSMMDGDTAGENGIIIDDHLGENEATHAVMNDETAVDSDDDSWHYNDLLHGHRQPTLCSWYSIIAIWLCVVSVALVIFTHVTPRPQVQASPSQPPKRCLSLHTTLETATSGTIQSLVTLVQPLYPPPNQNLSPYGTQSMIFISDLFSSFDDQGIYPRTTHTPITLVPRIKYRRAMMGAKSTHDIIHAKLHVSSPYAIELLEFHAKHVVWLLRDFSQDHLELLSFFDMGELNKRDPATELNRAREAIRNGLQEWRDHIGVLAEPVHNFRISMEKVVESMSEILAESSGDVDSDMKHLPPSEETSNRLLHFKEKSHHLQQTLRLAESADNILHISWESIDQLVSEFDVLTEVCWGQSLQSLDLERTWEEKLQCFWRVPCEGWKETKTKLQTLKSWIWARKQQCDRGVWEYASDKLDYEQWYS
ncbi:hypothetical protein G7046_g1204 [Stylonectria norvegica]|nr:hypothetical protein G7046_g1204 [Stylonectria norvegica]